MEKPKILVVDDAHENLQVLYATLKGEYDIFGVLSGQEALEFVAHTRPDLILLDIMMPAMDGFETCRRLKEIEGINEVPVIFITALTDELNEVQGFRSGAVDYITKPFKTLVVKMRVANHLALKQRTDELMKSRAELQEAYERIKVMSGLIPICMLCKKIRDDNGFWNQLETYITEHSDALFSHGLCPDCAGTFQKQIESEFPA